MSFFGSGVAYATHFSVPVKVVMIDPVSGKVKKAKVITKKSLLRGIEYRNKLIIIRHGTEVIPEKINIVPNLDTGILGVRIKIGKPDFTSINAVGQQSDNSISASI
ncbi:MAG: hypothetical protein JJW01_03835 [Alphaproteobacteria bacterium]|nr:hypothetical protein [Rickettsiales bacterium]